MSERCVCGHVKEEHDVCGWGSEVEHFCRACIRESSRKNHSKCGMFTPHVPQDISLPESREEADILLVKTYYPRARKSLCSGRILMGEDSLILGDNWQDAAENIRKNTQAHVKPFPTDIEAMEQVIKNIAKLTLEINSLQVKVMHEYHELHTRLERLKRARPTQVNTPQ